MKKESLELLDFFKNDLNPHLIEIVNQELEKTMAPEQWSTLQRGFSENSASQKFVDETNKIQKNIVLACDVIEDHYKSVLTADEIHRYEEELVRVGAHLLNLDREKITTLINKGEPLQRLYGIPDFVLRCLQKIAYQRYIDGYYEDASHIYHLLTILNSYVYEFWLGWGESLLMLNELPQAIRVFDYAIVLNPNEPISYYHLAESLININDSIKAEEVLDDLIKLIAHHKDKDRFTPLILQLKGKIRR